MLGAASTRNKPGICRMDGTNEEHRDQIKLTLSIWNRHWRSCQVGRHHTRDESHPFFGLISSGIVIWLAIGTLLMIESKSRVEFNVLYSVFMLAMLTSYYLFSAAYAEFLNTRVMLFWFAMFACSVVLGNVLFHKRNTKSFLVLYAMAALCFLVLDAVWINGIQLQAVIPEVLLSIGILIRINQKGNKGEF